MTNTIKFLDLNTSHSQVRGALDDVWEQAIETSGFIGGKNVDLFEADFAAYSDAAHCIGVGNGTDALELILDALGIGQGDEVIVPANTFVATAEAVARVGATPVFVDVDPETALITGATVAPAITDATKAVMAVHLYGQMVNMDDVLAVCEPAGVKVVEDSAQGHGATWRGRRAGSIGIAAGFSFYPGKNLGALGDGGAVTTNDAELAEAIRSRANHGRSLESKYEHDVLGRNSRLDGLQAAALRIKLAELDRWNEGRRNAAALYRKDLPESFVPYVEMQDARSVYHLFVVRTTVVPREVVGEALVAEGIQWGIHYPIPCHLQRPFRTEQIPSHPVSEEQAGQIMSLPMHPHLTPAEVERVCSVLASVEASYNGSQD
ncbi:MAG: DegT/DnrJ/EryC1/StrS family aminotransferase [Acidimicrobiia bacterium]